MISAEKHPFFFLIYLITALILVCTADFWADMSNDHLTTLLIASYGLIMLLLGVMSKIYDELRELRRRVEELEEDECY